jgi:hypothetical protein
MITKLNSTHQQKNNTTFGNLFVKMPVIEKAFAPESNRLNKLLYDNNLPNYGVINRKKGLSSFIIEIANITRMKKGKLSYPADIDNSKDALTYKLLTENHFEVWM